VTKVARSKQLDGQELLRWVASLPPEERDAAVEERLGIGRPQPSAHPGEHLIGYHASGVAQIVRMLIEVPVSGDDVFVDLGAGLGKVVMLTRLLTGATARGIELQAGLAAGARDAASGCGVNGVSFADGDARHGDIEDGTVFFLYAPFVGPVLAEVLLRLRAIACRRAIVVCSLALDLERLAPWLVRRPIDSFWLAIYDGAFPGVPPRPRTERSRLLGPEADTVAHELEGSRGR
jgi:hypothetical protein